MKVFEFKDYKLFLNRYIASMPKGGRGQAARLAQHLNVTSVAISQILKGNREFSQEQALDVAGFLGLDPRATDYFVTLVAKERSGSRKLAAYYQEKPDKLREEDSAVKAKVVKSQVLTDLEKARFYSNWYYSGIRMLSSVDGFNTIDSIAERFNLSRTKVASAIEFLLATGLCQEKDGKIMMGPSATFLAPDSEFANNHRRNWRMKSLGKMIEAGPNDLFYTGVYSLSNDDIKVIRKELLSAIEKVSQRVKDSLAEQVSTLIIDLFEF